MQVFFDDRQFGHAPEFYLRLGVNIPHPEQPERARLLREIMIELDHDIITPVNFGLDPIYAVHDPDYVDFSRTAYDRWVEGTGYTHPAIPNYHKGRRISRVPNGIIGKLGYYATDTSCPVMRGTRDAIYWPARCAVDAARRLAAGEGPAYALCRTPGHHASRDASNGFCFFNNAAVAAQELRGTFAEVAILDMDTHAGNGTEDIFDDRSDVFTTSMHTNPSNYPPYFAGYDDERGEGSHLNVVLSPGDDEAQILMRFNEMVTALQIFGAEALVVSLGFRHEIRCPPV